MVAVEDEDDWCGLEKRLGGELRGDAADTELLIGEEALRFSLFVEDMISEVTPGEETKLLME